MEILNLVRAGVTKPHVDSAARASWLAAVHDSVRTVGGAVVAAAEEPAVGRNYYRVGVRRRDGEPVDLLFNAAALLVAAAEPGDRRSVAVVFVDVPGGDVFSQAGFWVAAAAELEQPLREDHLQSLAEDERRDVAYHRPSRLGDLLFNWFD